jgi:hypothetical protein
MKCKRFIKNKKGVQNVSFVKSLLNIDKIPQDSLLRLEFYLVNQVGLPLGSN